jgi:hypothetical protein
MLASLESHDWVCPGTISSDARHQESGSCAASYGGWYDDRLFTPNRAKRQTCFTIVRSSPAILRIQVKRWNSLPRAPYIYSIVTWDQEQSPFGNSKDPSISMAKPPTENSACSRRDIRGTGLHNQVDGHSLTITRIDGMG